MKLYDSSKIDQDHLLFDNRSLWKLLIPLMVEQLLTSFMGMADSIMVSRVGSAAISAVSLTDSINVLVIQVLAALATGGTILCSQYIGHEDVKKANEAARQVLLTTVSISTALALVCIIFCRPLLRLIFGQVEADVMANSEIYFLITSASFPFLAMFQAGSAFYRAGKNSRFPMRVSIIGNAVNIVGNAVLIFVFHMGVVGAALATLISRVFLAAVVIISLRRPKQLIVLDHLLQIRPNFKMIGKVLTIGIPSGIENGMFQFGKLAIQSSVSTLGTSAIAAQAIMIIFENLNGVAAMGVGIGLMTVVGQTLGAGRKEEAKYYIVKLTKIAWMVIIVSCLTVWAIGKPVTIVAGLEEESARICLEMLNFVTVMKIFAWTLSFIPPYGLRAAGDVRFSMIVSSLTMWFCRVALSTFLIRVMGFGPIAVWIGMAADWCIRSVIFSARYLSGRWLKHQVI